MSGDTRTIWSARRTGLAAAVLLLPPALTLHTPAQAAEGEEIYTLVLVDRLEYQTNEGDDLLLWDAQAWLGGDYDKLWVKTEGERTLGGVLEEAQLQALYSRAIAPFWDLQVGVQHDFEPNPSRTSGVIGIQGLARYWFEVDAAAFVSEDGDVSARVEAEYELLITQQLVLQPRAELSFAVQDVEELGIGSGLSTAELGLRLRYEVKREVAPYVGVSWSRKVGETARFARDEGEDVSAVSFVAGIRLWF
jgi:copper resistance protein B